VPDSAQGTQLISSGVSKIDKEIDFTLPGSGKKVIVYPYQMRGGFTFLKGEAEDQLDA
jgi:hypothetical protein